MSAGALGAALQVPGPNAPGNSSFSLQIDGIEIIRKVPADYGIRITEVAGDASNFLTFTVEDPTSAVRLVGGSIVLLRDLRGQDRKLFQGNLVTTVMRHGAGGLGRITECTAVSWDAWLDWKMIDIWKAGILKDQNMVESMTTARGDFGVNGPVQARDAEVNLTNAAMDDITLKTMSHREGLQRIADLATSQADTPTRHFYVDYDRFLHYYKNIEGLTAPYRISDSDYTSKVLASSGLVSLWSFREASGATCYDAMSYRDGTLSGGYTRGQSALVVNEEQLTATKLNGSSGYMTASGNNLHGGDTFSVGITYKRTSTGAQMALWSGGSAGPLIGFDASDHIRVQKEGTGDNFVSTATYTGTAKHNLVVTRSPGSTTVYLDGSAIAGTTTARTFTDSTGAINIGRKLSTTDQFFDGTVHHAFYSANELSAARVAILDNQANSLAPDDLQVDSQYSDIVHSVYVKGTGAGTGWVSGGTVNDPVNWGGDTHKWEKQAVIDRPDSDSNHKKLNFGRAYLSQWGGPIVAIQFSITGYDGWRAGQKVYITDSAMDTNQVPLDGTVGYEIKQLDTDVNLGNGDLTYTIYAGALPQSGIRRLSRRG